MRDEVRRVARAVFNEAEDAAHQDERADAVQDPKHLFTVAMCALCWQISSLAVHADVKVYSCDHEGDESSHLEGQAGNNDLFACKSEIELHGTHD